MLARTHGQIAVPTTLGKELAVFAGRSAFFLEKMLPFQFGGKLNGAVGNYNAHQLIFPDKDWVGFSERFVRNLGLEPATVTTQIEPGTRLVYFLDLLRQLNNIWLDLTRDCWLYIGLGYFDQRVGRQEVGSSTMPHKVNPIDLENAEGNLEMANQLLVLLADKLSVSRLQRDLSDKTIKRNLGVAFGHSLLAVRSLTRGLGRITPNQPLLQQEVQAHPEVLAEALQLLLRTYGEDKAYEQVRSLVQGKKVDWKALVAGTKGERRKVVEKWLPEAYTGLAAQLAAREIERVRTILGIEDVDG
jgi:adenylosuccinate lyase